MLGNVTSITFFRFLVAGGMAAVINLTGRYFLNLVTGFETAVLLAYLIGMITAYVLMRSFVFQVSGRSVASEFRRFAIVNIFGLFLVMAVSVGLARRVFPAIGLTWHAHDIAHLIGVSVPAVASYFGHGAYTFARSTSPMPNTQKNRRNGTEGSISGFFRMLAGSDTSRLRR